MHVRHFFFLLFFLVSTNSLQGQDEVMTLVNNPFAETVRPVLDFQSGQLVAKLVNGFRQTVVLNQIRLSQDGLKSTGLLKTPVDLEPAETKYITLPFRGIDLRQNFRLVLDISPLPPKQRSDFVFRFETETNRIVEVESDARP